MAFPSSSSHFRFFCFWMTWIWMPSHSSFSYFFQFLKEPFHFRFLSPVNLGVKGGDHLVFALAPFVNRIKVDDGMLFVKVFVRVLDQVVEHGSVLHVVPVYEPVSGRRENIAFRVEKRHA